MSFPKLTFPLTVERHGEQYWIGEEGPFKYGEAVTSFFTEDENFFCAEDGTALKRELEMRLQVYGRELGTKNVVISGSCEEFNLLGEHDFVDCTIAYDYRQVGRSLILAEQYTFFSLHDFLYADLGKAVLLGNSPRKCRLCGNWFFHEQGDRAIYCERIAPGEETKTCREVGARAVFENKLQSEETWKLYKRAYKKYYARMMKGNMSREDFNAWVEKAAATRDSTILLLEVTKGAEKRTALIDELREELNRD